MPPERSVSQSTEKKIEMRRDLNRGPLGPSSRSPTLYPLDHGDPLKFNLFYILFQINFLQVKSLIFGEFSLVEM